MAEEVQCKMWWVLNNYLIFIEYNIIFKGMGFLINKI
jgi:hypothetical protein